MCLTELSDIKGSIQTVITKVKPSDEFDIDDKRNTVNDILKDEFTQ